MPTLPLKETPSLISVIIPVYNQEKHVGHCLKSILNQSYDHLEVLVVNDGSIDRSRQILAGLATKDKRITLIDQQNQGEALARRRGYEQAHGDFIMFVDHDDCLLPNAIELLYNAIIETRVDVVCGHALRKWGLISRPIKGFPATMSGRIITQKELFDSYYVSYFGINLFPVSLWGKIYRKAVIDKAMKTVDLFTTPHLHFGGDEAFNLLLFPYLDSAFFLEKTVYLYRWGGLTSGFNRHLPELLDLSDFKLGLLDKYHYQKGYVPLFVEYANILVSHVLQCFEYGEKDPCEIKKWLQDELDSRYLVQRMDAFFLHTTEIPDKCRKVIDRDIDGILGLASNRLEQQRLRSLAKKLILRRTRH